VKTKKTARELEAMVSANTGVPATRVKVFPDKTYGWRAVVYVAPQDAETAQQRAAETAQELRTRFDLED
jgi:hypothetical protein